MTRRTWPQRLHDDERGVVLVFVLVLMAVLLGMLALVVDVGNARQQRRQAQTAADASALAGAEVLETFGPGFVGSPSQWTAVVQQVKGYARQNWNVKPGDWTGCTDGGHLSFTPDGSNTCISADFSLWSAPLPGDPINTVNRLRVRLPQRSIASIFGSVLGVGSLSTAASATASVTRTSHTITTEYTTPGGPCALCILADSGHTLDGQNGDVTITGGGVTVNSVSLPAASLNPNGHVKITVPCNNSVTPPVCHTIGGPAADQSGNFTGSGFAPAPSVKSRVDDPLYDVPQCGDGSYGAGPLGVTAPPMTPPPTDCPTNLITTNAKGLNATLSPGIYEHGIEGTHVLNPGVYVLKGDIVLNGNDTISVSTTNHTGLDGVMLFMACSNYPQPCSAGGTPAGIKTTGNGSLRLTAPTSGTYRGMTIFADRANTATQTFRGNGTNESGPTSGSSGTIYLKAGTLDLRGNGYTLASMIIVNGFEMDGNPSAVTIAYDIDKNYATVTHHTETSTSYSYDATGLVG